MARLLMKQPRPYKTTTYEPLDSRNITSHHLLLISKVVVDIGWKSAFHDFVATKCLYGMTGRDAGEFSRGDHGVFGIVAYAREPLDGHCETANSS